MDLVSVCNWNERDKNHTDFNLYILFVFGFFNIIRRSAYCSITVHLVRLSLVLSEPKLALIHEDLSKDSFRL